MHPKDEPELGAANARRRLDQSVEHRPEFGPRMADDLQYVAGGSLVFEQLLQIACALAQFIEQPRILHRDHRLRREVLQQRDLLLAEGPRRSAVVGEVSKDSVVLAERNGEKCADAPDIG